MAASGGAWTHPLLRGAHEPTGVVSLSVPSGTALASRAVAAQPDRPRPLGSHAAPYHPLAATAFCLSSLSPASHGRHHLRQEPDAGIPLVRIRGGGYERSSFLLRLPYNSCIKTPVDGQQKYVRLSFSPVDRLKERMPSPKSEVLQGTLDLLVLKTLATMGPMHGFGIALRIQQISKDLLQLNQGTLYPALLRHEQRGWITSKWGS